MLVIFIIHTLKFSVGILLVHEILYISTITCSELQELAGVQELVLVYPMVLEL